MNKVLFRSSFFTAVVMLLFLTGCRAITPPEPANPMDRQWTASDYAMTFGDTDPCEGFNRSMFAVSEFGVLYVVRPVGWLWGSILPLPVINCVDNAATNLAFPARAISCILQNRWKDSGIELSRFLINLTVGIGGLFDPADKWFHLYQRDEDFGQAFASWGCGPGYTFVLPLLSSTNIRDGVGYIFDYLFDIKTYIPYYVGTATRVNKLVKDYRTMEQVFIANADPYETFKEFSVINRQLAMADYQLKLKQKMEAELLKKQEEKTEKEKTPPAPAVVRKAPAVQRPAGISGKIITLPDYAPENPWSDSARVLFMQPQTDHSPWWVYLSLWNNTFSKQAEERDLQPVFRDADSMTYRFWRSPDPEKFHKAPLAILFPGLGGGHTNGSSVALAEVLNRQGYAVLLVPSVYCWRFYQANFRERLPGYSPDDAFAARQAVLDILTDLREKVSEGNRFTPDGIHLIGSSMGAVHALHIAALETRDRQLNARRIIAVNPPVDLQYAMAEVDRCAQAARGKNPEEVTALFTDGFAKAMLATSVQKPWRDAPPAPAHTRWDLQEILQVKQGDYRTGLAPTQAQMLTAISFGFTLREVMLVACRDRRADDLEKFEYSWGSRTAFYAKVDTMGFTGYMKDLLLPEYRRLYHDNASFDELLFKSGLYSIADTLKNDRSIVVMHNLNDFLTSEKDRQFLDRTLQDRITWFDQGSHLGNLYDGKWQQELLLRLK